MKHDRMRKYRAELGYTLVEVMVAITIAVFLLAGLFTILQQTRKTSNETSGISQLQDDERVAMSILTDVIQQAGYVPEANGSGASLFAADTVFGYGGQVIAGGSGAAVGDKIIVRNVLATNDTTLDCLGETNTGGEKVFAAVIDIETNTKTGVNQLMCSPYDTAPPQSLVNNVVNLTFQYAVNTTSASSTTASNATGPNSEATGATGYGCPADAYIPTASMSATDWTNVCAVKVDLTFVNPLYQPAGQPQPTPGQPQYVTFERVIGVLSKTGVNVTKVTQT